MKFQSLVILIDTNIGKPKGHWLNPGQRKSNPSTDFAIPIIPTSDQLAAACPFLDFAPGFGAGKVWSHKQVAIPQTQHADGPMLKNYVQAPSVSCISHLKLS